MPPDSSNNPTTPPLQAPPSARRPGAHWMLYGCGTFVALGLVIIATVAITIWWIQRPIKPVVLSPQEKAAVDQKLRTLAGDKPTNAESPESSTFAGNRSSNPKTAVSPVTADPATDAGGRPDRSY